MTLALFIIFGVTLVPMVGMGIVLLRGRGAFLIAGYNTLSKEERARYDEKAMCRSAGWLMMGVSFATLLIPAGIYWQLSWLSWGGGALTVLVSVGYALYANTGGRFLKEPDAGAPAAEAGEAQTPKRNKAALAAITVIAALALACTGGLAYAGNQDPAVQVLAGGIVVDCLYGVRIGLEEIAGLSLLEESMREIGPGRRTNGYGGFGGALKGHFRSDALGETLLFVQADTAPTIRIARHGGKDVYISLRTGEETRALYEKLAAALP